MVVKKSLRFNIGDWIVHYYHGVGQVKDIVEKGLEGNEKTFYRVTTKDIDYWIPLEEEDSDHIEPIRSKKDFDEALAVLATKPEPMAKYHKSRKKKIHDRWMDGDLLNRAKLLRDLNGRLKLKKLSFSEKEMLEKVRKYFISEWLIVDSSLTPAKAKKKIRKALKVGVKEAKNELKEKEE
jgi:RNA polymerase-interacting CarD/CdnL/TRCF family regulator